MNPQDYASKGWRVIPLHRVGPDGQTCSCSRGRNCTSKGKHPRDEAWQSKAPLSPSDIEATWGGAYPPNVGLATGADSGFWALDIDPEKGGAEAMGALVATHGRLPDTWVVQTGSGGYHYYFTMPDEPLRNTSGQAGPGIDTRANGGQVVAPPSRTDKGSYSVVSDHPLAPAPEWLLALIRPKTVDISQVMRGDLPQRQDLPEPQRQRLDAYAAKAVAAELGRLRDLHPDVWEARGSAPWNHTTFQVACSLIEIANSDWTSYGISRAHRDLLENAPRDAGFDDSTIEKCWNSATSRVGDQARPMPAERGPDPLFEGAPRRRLGKDEPPEQHQPQFFSEKGSLQVDVLGQAVRDQGMIGWGRDESWWSYEGGVWRPDPNVVRRRCARLLGGRLRRNHASEVTEYLRFAEGMTHINGDPHRQLMNFSNGMLDWQTGQLAPHDPSHHSTVQFPLAWEPDATCPTFDRFLADVMHEDYVDLAWKMIGYLMLSGNPIQVAFLLYGSGGNGKGTLIRVIRNILGDANIASEPLDRLNGDRFSAINLFAKIACIAGDIDATYQESTANFKRLTGEDTVPAERKYGDRFYFDSWAVPVFSANKIPGSADVTEGYLRRWVVLHFHKRVANPVHGLSDLLSTETAGIAARAVLELRELMRVGQFQPRGRATQARKEFAEAVDQVRRWAALQTPAPGSWAPLAALYVDYTIWADRAGQRRVHDREFSHRLEAIGLPTEARGGVLGHLGIKSGTAPAAHQGIF